MPHEAVRVLVDAPETDQAALEHVSGSPAATAEATIDTPEDPMAASLAGIDTEKFAAVSEHGGSLKEAIQLFKDNPNAPLPRCVRNLGFTSVDQLVKRVEGTDDPTKRAPTIKELREAKRKEKEKPAAAATTSDAKPKTAKVTDAVRTTKTEQVIPVEFTEHLQAKEMPQKVKVAPEVLEDTATPSDQLDPSILHAVKPTEESISSSTEIALRQQALDLEASRIAEIEESHTQTLPEAENSTAAVPQIPISTSGIARSGIARSEDFTRTEARTSTVAEVTTEGLGSETVGNDIDLIETDEEGTGVAAELEDGAGAEVTFDIGEVMADLGFELRPELLDASDESRLVDENDTNDIEVEGPAVDTESLISKAALDKVNIDFRESAETEAEAEESHDLRAELDAYIESLEPDKAASAKTVLKPLFDVLSEDHTEIDSSSGALSDQIKEIERFSTELLAVLRDSDKDRALTKLMQELLASKSLGGVVQDQTLSIDQLNHLGTFEHKLTFVTTLFTGLVKSIKQHLAPYVRLGKYALSASSVMYLF